MPEEFQCRLCQESYKNVLGFLDHFETHVQQQNEQQNASHQGNEPEKGLQHQDKNVHNAASFEEVLSIKHGNEVIKTCEKDSKPEKSLKRKKT